ncbi:MAG: hypothetical protein HY849_01325 [Nitrosomonadales bacterium]|nr:hypothetical protein [Nitrosomonadales bacterium]
MLNTVNTPSQPTLLGDAVQHYERRFGATPEWLSDLSNGRILALLQHALRRGAPLIAADVLH